MRERNTTTRRPGDERPLRSDTGAIFTSMAKTMRAAALVALALAALLGALPNAASSATSPAPNTGAGTRALLKSRELWATIDVCSPKDQPDTVGVRGSMPGDGRAGDRMYMSFRLQYMNPAGTWVDLAGASTPSFVSVGAAGTAREGGRSFQLVPPAGRPASEIRGVVSFQWRHGRTVLARGSRATSAAHKSVAGADPPGFSAASCLVG
jgi:hypothetical protein